MNAAFGLKEEIKQVTEAMKNTKNCRMLLRYPAIKLHLEGYPTKEVAKIIGRTTETVNTYVAAYLDAGLNGLLMKLPSGRPSFITAEQKQAIITD